jgi:hypothetical protein
VAQCGTRRLHGAVSATAYRAASHDLLGAQGGFVEDEEAEVMRERPLPPQNEPRLRGPWLLLAQAAWLILVGSDLATFLAATPQYLRYVAHPCDEGTCLLTTPAAHALTRAGLSLTAYAWVTFNFALLIVVVVALTMSLTLLLRRRREWMVMLVSCYILISQS